MSTSIRSRSLAGVIVTCLALLGGMAGIAYAAITFTNATLRNGWQPGRAYTAYPGYTNDSLGVVFLRGSLKDGKEGDEAFAMPLTLATGHDMWLPIFTFANTAAGLEIGASGQVIPIGSTIKYLQPLDGMNFVAASSKIEFTNATLENGWTYGGDSSAEPGYAIDSFGVVHLRGGLAGGSSGAAAFVLPAALRPSYNMWLPVYTNGATEGFVEIDTAGDVTPTGSNATGYSSLDGITFVAGSSTKIKFTNAKLSFGFTDGGYGSAPPGYAKDSLGVVHLRGGLRQTGQNEIPFVLPKGFRPTHEVNVPMYTYDGTEGLADITSTGKLIVAGGDVQGYASLDGISFIAGQ